MSRVQKLEGSRMKRNVNKPCWHPITEEPRKEGMYLVTLFFSGGHREVRITTFDMGLWENPLPFWCNYKITHWAVLPRPASLREINKISPKITPVV